MNDLAKWLRAEWDRAAAVALVVLGLIFVAIGYNGVANSPYVAEELAYLASGAVGGLFLLGCGATLWLSADLHDECLKMIRRQPRSPLLPYATLSRSDQIHEL